MSSGLTDQLADRRVRDAIDPPPAALCLNGMPETVAAQSLPGHPSQLRTARCTCIPEEHDHGMGKLTVRAGLPGVTIFAPVPRAPALDLYPGRLATTDAQ
jgi:hypothetical protein